jgi:hypothetical protein
MSPTSSKSVTVTGVLGRQESVLKLILRSDVISEMIVATRIISYTCYHYHYHYDYHRWPRGPWHIHIVELSGMLYVICYRYRACTVPVPATTLRYNPLLAAGSSQEPRTRRSKSSLFVFVLELELEPPVQDQNFYSFGTMNN